MDASGGRAPLRTGVVGLGIWGRNHAELYRDYPVSNLVVVCDLDEERARSCARGLGCDWTTSVSEVAASDVEAVSVATPDHTHAGPVLELLAAGKHVLVEKPLTTDLAQAQALAAAAARSGAVSMVDFHLRWRPQFQEAKSLLESGELGPPIMGYVRLSDTLRVATEWLPWAGASGPEWFLFSHSMDLVRWMLEREPVGFFSRGRRGLLESRGIPCWDAIQTSVDFGDCFVTFETSWIVPDSAPAATDNDFVLYGERGRISYENTSGLRLTSDRYQELTAPTIGRRNRFGVLDHFVYEPIRYFVDSARGRREPMCTFQDGLVNVAMITASVRSLLEGREVAFVDVLVPAEV